MTSFLAICSMTKIPLMLKKYLKISPDETSDSHIHLNYSLKITNSINKDNKKNIYFCLEIVICKVSFCPTHFVKP